MVDDLLRVHHLKTLPRYFEDLIRGAKTFELRQDRGFQVGDVLDLIEHSSEHGCSGRRVCRRVFYLLRGPFVTPAGNLGLPEGWVIMGLVWYPGTVSTPSAEAALKAATALREQRLGGDHG